MEHRTASDAELAGRAQHGDTEAYAELLRRYQDQALGTAFVILGERQDAEDAVQEAFTRAFLALKNFRPDGSFRAWLLRIVVNEAHDLRSRAQRRSELSAASAGQLPGLNPAASAEAAALSRQRREALLRALFELREDDRLIITYRYFLDFSEAETAEVLGVARGTVKSRLARALGRLRPILERLGPLVVVGPALDKVLAPLVEELQHASGAPARPELAQAALARIGITPPRPQPHGTTSLLSVAAAVVVAVVGVFIGGLALSAGTRAEPGPPPAPPTPSAPPTSAAYAGTIVYGGDLAPAERQELAAVFGTDAGSSREETVSRQELGDALRAQGIPVVPTDAALSSAYLVCRPPGSGLDIQTHNISLIPPHTYASALMIAGLTDAAVTIAAPAREPVTGEAALVGAMRAAPTCLGNQPDPDRVRLAYAQVYAVLRLSRASGSSPERASAVLQDVLDAIASGQARDDADLDSALGAALAQAGVPVDDEERGRLLALFHDLVGLDFGPYRQGFRMQQLAPDRALLVPLS